MWHLTLFSPFYIGCRGCVHRMYMYSETDLRARQHSHVVRFTSVLVGEIRARSLLVNSAIPLTSP